MCFLFCLFVCGLVALVLALAIQRSTALSKEQRDWIASSATFTLGTYAGGQNGGADASNRGGTPGFIKALDERTIVFPDYKVIILLFSSPTPTTFQFWRIIGVLHTSRAPYVRIGHPTSIARYWYSATVMQAWYKRFI